MSSRILIADPDEQLSQSYRRYLCRQGYEVATVTTGLECVQHLESFRPDVLVLEPQLPWGGGDGVLAILQEPHRRSIPVMVVAQELNPQQLYRVREFPVSAYYVKPVTPGALADRLRQLEERTAPQPV